MDGLILLEQAQEAGLSVRADGDKLLIRGPKRAEPLALLLIQRKPEVMAALVAPEPASEASEHRPDPAWWRRHYLVRTINWELSGARKEGRARGIAWGELQDHWHRLHGAQAPKWECAGCREPIGGLPAIELADGNRVHL